VISAAFQQTDGFELHRNSCRVSVHNSLNVNYFDSSPARYFESNSRGGQRQCNHRFPSTTLYSQSDDSHGNDNDDNTRNEAHLSSKSSSRRLRLRKRLAKYGKILLLSSSLSLAAMPKPAQAKFSHEISEEKIMSLRPGVSQSQAIDINEGEVPDDLPEAHASRFSTEAQATEEDASASARRKKEISKKSFDYGDNEDDDYDMEDEYFLQEQQTLKGSRSAPGRTSVAQSDANKANAFQAGTKSQFSGVMKKSKADKKRQTLKVSLGTFVPTFGAMFLREFIRRRKEETYVQKGLKILEAQKAEYFNVTETTADSEIEDDDDDEDDDDEDDDEEDEDDENDDEDDDDDDEDDDDDDVDDDESPSQRPSTKRPTGGGGNGSGSSGDEGDGSGRPSEDDLKRLGDIFDKS